MKIVWLGVLVVAAFLGLTGIWGALTATAAPAQAGSAAVACAGAVVPYVMARAMEAIARKE